MMNKELRKIRDELESQGFATRVTKKGRLQVFLNGAYVATFAGNPGDVHSLRNALGKARRAGFRWPP